jgi:hypothetical protein
MTTVQRRLLIATKVLVTSVVVAFILAMTIPVGISRAEDGGFRSYRWSVLVQPAILSAVIIFVVWRL